MLCNVCGLEEATIHLTEIINTKMVELHLCEQCAYEKGTDVKQYFNFSELLEGLSEAGEMLKSPSEKKEAVRCKGCGISFDDFGKSGRLGCPECYQTFSKQLLPLIKRIHRATQHVGKKPSKISGEVKFHMELRELHERLRKLVEQEAFEDAAKVRDLIKQLEDRAKKGTEKHGS
ncbi:MAG: UvrB/UvrC motif-containing protein [Candidatus Omnitrophica bacterium]|nr:UvrB/UvrC motif-containing protein [Candidatus Omnitrophota bacterium]